MVFCIVKLEAITAISVKGTVVLDVTPQSLVKIQRRSASLFTAEEEFGQAVC
jgi:hypothetical protein